MLLTRWFRRWCIACGGVLLLSGVVLAVRLSSDLLENARNRSRARLERVAGQVAEALASPNLVNRPNEKDVVRRIADRNGVKGEWVPASETPPESDYGGIEAARRDGSAFWIDDDPRTGVKAAHFASSLGDGEKSGVVHVWESLEDAYAERNAVLWRFSVLFAAVALVTALAAWQMHRGISRATTELEAAIRNVADGDLNATVATQRSDEFGRLAEQFNEMTAAVKDRFEQQTRAAHELEERQEFLGAVLATMVEAVIAVDGNQRILFANRAAHRLLGMKHQELVGRPIWEVARSPVLQETLQRVLTENAEQRIEFQLPRTKSVVILAAGRLPGNPPPGAVLVLHDVTELRRLEGLRRDFVSNVSHELKTPLTAIQAYADTLLEGGLDDAAHNREFVQRICEAAERLHALIQNVLALGRIEAEEQVSETRPVSLRETADLCLREHAAVAEAKSLRLTVEHADEDLHVLADEEGLRTILDNLVDNAINYTPAGGSVTLRYRDAGDAVQIEVSDTGIGIPREHRDRIFERFYRVDRARSRELGGTGLGLSIVKHLALAYDGSVSVESVPNHGSTFTVRLPRAVGVEGTRTNQSVAR